MFGVPMVFVNPFRGPDPILAASLKIVRIPYFGTPKIYTTTGIGPRKNREMAGVDDLVVYTQTAVKYNTFYIHTPGVRSAPGVVYIQTVVFYSSLHIHHQIVHTSHFPIFSRPKPGGGVYLWAPHLWRENQSTYQFSFLPFFDYTKKGLGKAGQVFHVLQLPCMQMQCVKQGAVARGPLRYQ